MEAIASFENLFLAAARARRGKSRRPDVEDWWLQRAEHLGRLREELRSGAYRPGPYRFFEIREPKRRLIAAAPFEDRVVHHALCNLLSPVLERRFIARSCSRQDGLRRAYARWPLAARLKRRQRRTSRVVRGGSWNNDNPANLSCSYRNNNDPENRNNNLGFRVVCVDGVSRKADCVGVMSGGADLPGRCQEASLTAVPAPVG